MDAAIRTNVMRARQKIAYQASANAIQAFTLVEIMVVVAIIGVTAALVLPSMAKARKQSQGRRIVNDARELNAAVDQWAVDTFRKDGDVVNTLQAASYLGGSWPNRDILGNPYAVGTVGPNPVTIARRTKNQLKGVGIDWGTF